MHTRVNVRLSIDSESESKSMKIKGKVQRNEVKQRGFDYVYPSLQLVMETLWNMGRMAARVISVCTKR